jgi:hypothetical protein
MTFYVRFGLHGRAAVHDAQVKTFLAFLAFSWVVMAAWALLEIDMATEMLVHEVLAHVASVLHGCTRLSQGKSNQNN